MLDDTQDLISVNPGDAAFIALSPDNGQGEATVGGIENPLRFSPIDWVDGGLFRLRLGISTESAGSASDGTLDAPDAIQLSWLAPTTEQGQSDFTIRGVPGLDPSVAIMNQAASPHPGVINEYQSYFHTNRVTRNTEFPGFTRIKPFIQIFNTAAFGFDLGTNPEGGPSGADPFVIESFTVEKLITPP
ncbi:hypothetical protein IIC65_05315 [Candidatus Sumerlaeota bacterium]|nr:hypothetical protein [Candidatus Sumerlaeota bacterium]